MSSTKIVTLAELQSHTTRKDFWMLLHGKVYNVTGFMDEHPGGDEVILTEAGQDATEAFEDVGHSDEARALLPGMFVGDFESKGSKKAGPNSSPNTSVGGPEQGFAYAYIAPIALLAAYYAYKHFQ